MNDMENDFFELSDEQKAELDAMREAHAKGEVTFLTWEEVKTTLQERLKKRIEKEKEGKGVYGDAKKATYDIKELLKNIKHKEL